MASVVSQATNQNTIGSFQASPSEMQKVKNVFSKVFSLVFSDSYGHIGGERD